MSPRNRCLPAAVDTLRVHGDAGATSIEYSLIASLIAVAVIGSVTLVGLNVLALFNLMPAGL
jgi:Flp pilus assembly pilin Flp